MKLIVGLGNPGKKYELTRHNVGFEVIDLFCNEIGAGRARRQNLSLVMQGQLGTEDLILAKPQTFMNSSGVAISSLVSAYGIQLDNLYVVYDDLDLDLGILRIRRKGSAGGHRGMKSIISSLGTQFFPRLRIGIGQLDRGTEAIDYVLGRFTHRERQQVQQTEYMAADALRVMICGGINSAMNKFNVRQEIEEI